jgi:prepilin-type N-terminal cleavage/methylation domain-containing protein
VSSIIKGESFVSIWILFLEKGIIMVKKGFSLVELMVVIAIVATLAALAFPTFGRLLAKAKRTEAFVQLRSLCAAQKVFHLENGTYTTKLSGPESIGWRPEGYKQKPKEENFYYTYGFPGTQGLHYFVGKLETPASYLAGADVHKDAFTLYAAGYINGTAKADIIAIDQNGAITIIQDALE